MTERTVPILPARDFDETHAFYERLGFGLRGRWDDYLILARGPLELHFFPKPDVDPLTTDFMCYLHVEDADRLYDEWNAVGVEHDAVTGSRLVAPVDTDYGMREFALVDPNGNLLRAGSS